MSIGDKFNEMKGEAKDKIGDATDNHELQAEGKADKAEANLSQAADKVKGAFKDAKDAITG